MAQKFKMLNNEVSNIVEKIGKEAPKVTEMENLRLQELKEAIGNTIGMIKSELNIVQEALKEVIKAVEGEIARRGISDKVEKNISIFDKLPGIESK